MSAGPSVHGDRAQDIRQADVGGIGEAPPVRSELVAKPGVLPLGILPAARHRAVDGGAERQFAGKMSRRVRERRSPCPPGPPPRRASPGRTAASSSAPAAIICVEALRDPLAQDRRAAASARSSRPAPLRSSGVPAPALEIGKRAAGRLARAPARAGCAGRRPAGCVRRPPDRAARVRRAAAPAPPPPSGPRQRARMSGVHGRHVVDPAEQRAKIEPRAAADDRQTPGLAELAKHLGGVPAIGAASNRRRRARHGRRADASARGEILVGGPGGQDPQAVIDLHGIGVDDDAAESPRPAPPPGPTCRWRSARLSARPKPVPRQRPLPP